MSRIETLLSEMTLPEKLGQLTMSSGSYALTGPLRFADPSDAIRAGTLGNMLNVVGSTEVHALQRIAVEESRLGIPLLIGFDVLHGHRTLFPVPLAETAALDEDAWARTAREAAAEACADGISMAFAPMLDVARDPRWGRGIEGPGEDPWLAERFARAKVRGFQGRELGSQDSVAAVAKHFCAYGPVMAGREYASVDISERTLHEVHLPPFAAALGAGVVAIMPAFHDLAGVPLTAHVPLLQGWLRERLGFDGVIVSDYNAIGGLILHGVAADLTEASALALNAGVDIDMMADAYNRALPGALDQGLVQLSQVDTAVRRVLRLKEALGLLDDPYRRGTRTITEATVAERRKLARSVGARAIVMLKNEEGTLPLAESMRRVAVVGPLADAPEQMGGPWPAAGNVEAHVSVLAGLMSALPLAAVRHEAGTALAGAAATDARAALELCTRSDIVILCLGEAAIMSGEAACRTDLDLPGQQRSFAEALLEHCRARGKPVVALLFSGRPLVVPWLIDKADAVLACWFLGSEAGHAIADVLTGRISPSGRTPVTWPRSVGQIPIFFGQRPSGRPANPADSFTSKYLDAPNEPLFAFGHGLTYGDFVLSNLQATPRCARRADAIDVRVDVFNRGTRAAEETVFLFTHDRVASIARPLLELKGFGKIFLEPGERGTVTLPLAAADLCFLGSDLTPVFEPGEVEVLVGPRADRAVLLRTSIQLLP